MIPIQTNNTTGAVVIYANPACLPPDPAPVGHTNYTVDGIPAAPVPLNGAVLLWQAGALAWVVPTPTPQQTYAAAVAAGYTVPGIQPPLVLDLGPNAQSRFTSLLVLINTNLAANPATATQTQVIFDCQGAGQVFTFAQLQTMLMEYGNYAAGLLNALHAASTAPAA